MALLDRPAPGEPAPGQVVVAPEAVGICGSDYHFFAGELSEEAGGSQFPRVQGHEVGATVVAVGPDSRGRLAVGQRVALLPLVTRAGSAIRAASGAPTRATTSS